MINLRDNSAKWIVGKIIDKNNKRVDPHATLRKTRTFGYCHPETDSINITSEGSPFFDVFVMSGEFGFSTIHYSLFFWYNICMKRSERDEA